MASLDASASSADIASLGLTSWAFTTGHYSIVPGCIFFFIAAHAVGQGTVDPGY
ncbi:MAG: hypothetical protein QM757_27640 [Paludibaculum sp.]